MFVAPPAAAEMKSRLTMSLLSLLWKFEIFSGLLAVSFVAVTFAAELRHLFMFYTHVVQRVNIGESRINGNFALWSELLICIIN
jgi:hypothetical protein